MRVFILSCIAQLLLNPYIFWRSYPALPKNSAIRRGYIALFSAELLLFFTGLIFHTVLPDPIMATIELICDTWYFATLYISLALVLLEPFRLKVQTRQVVYPLILAATIAVMYSAHYSVAHPVIKHLTIEIDKRCTTHDSLTVVFMADLHISELNGPKRIRQYIAMCQSVHPDLILIGGDVIDLYSRFATQPHLERDFRKLQPPLGTFIIPGNHEHRGDVQAKYDWLREIGTLLIDSVTQPDNGFYLIGRDDRSNKQRRALHQLSDTLDRTKPILLLDHNPEKLQEVSDEQIDLALYGHTHDGQIWPQSMLLRWVLECSYGYYRKGNTQFYVTSGIGFAGPPYRFLTNSEMVVLHLRFKHGTR